MKLYDVPNHSMIKVIGDIETPIASPEIKEGEILDFKKIDGMYSFCKNSKGEIVHLVAWADVELVGNPDKLAK